MNPRAFRGFQETLSKSCLIEISKTFTFRKTKNGFQSGKSHKKQQMSQVLWSLKSRKQIGVIQTTNNIRMKKPEAQQNKIFT